MPIVSDGDPIGAIIMLCFEQSAMFGDVEIKCLKLMANVLSELLYFEG